MNTNDRNRKRQRLRIALCLLPLMLFCVGLWYISDYYHADSTAYALLDAPYVSVEDNLTVLSPDDSDKNTGIIFYPGAKVEADAYLPLLSQLQAKGYTCYLVHMPAHLAILNSDAATDVIVNHPDIDHWYLAGHSLGGAMASHWAASNASSIDGLILLGAYLDSDYPPKETLTIYGSLNTSVAEKITYTDNVVVIDGGNHAQFGNYGPQDGDAQATITPFEQQSAAVTTIDSFITKQQS